MRILSYFKSLWPILIFIIAESVAITMAQVAFDIKWVTNINIWLSEIFWQLFLFELFAVIFGKVKNQHLQLLLTVLPSIFIAHTISLTFTEAPSIWDIIRIILYIALMLCFVAKGIIKGQQQIRKEETELKLQYKQAVSETPPEKLAIIHNCKRLEEEHPEEFAFIRRFSMEFVDDIIATEKELKNESNDTEEN